MNTETNINQLASEIATEIVEHRIGSHLTWDKFEDGSECFTEEAQDLFIELYDIVHNKLIQL
jgi:hypothetical protein